MAGLRTLIPGIALAAAACSSPQEAGWLPPVEQSSPPTAPAPKRAAPAVPPQVRRALSRIGQRKDPPCRVFDYFPQGGMRSFYCHLRPLLSYQTAQKLSGVKVFLSGPHTEQRLVFGSSDFGRYNPAFVRWLNRVAAGIAGNKQLVRATRPVYRKYVSYLAHNMLGAHVKLQKNPDYLRREVKSRKWTDYNRYFFFMNPNFIDNPDRSGSYYWRSGGDGDGFDGNVVKTCVAFWMRRTVDGTSDQFAAALRTLICAYDRGLVYKLGGRCPKRL